MLLQFLLYVWAHFYVEAYWMNDVRLIARHYQCPPHCVFMHRELSSKTIEFFPKCDVVCGVLTFNENTDLTEVQLTEVIKNMKMLNGGIRIENSNLETLSFFGYHLPGLKIDCSFYGLTIRNNERLRDVQSLTEFEFLRLLDISSQECPIRIDNNQQLSMGSLCDTGSLATVIDIRTSGNLKDCACSGDSITTETLSQYSECRVIFGGLKISNIQGTLNLPNITQIRGSIIIENTDLESLDFLKNLELHMFYRGTVAWDIKNNPNMHRLGFSLTTKYKLQPTTGKPRSVISANLENLHPEFCVTLEETVFFLENRFEFQNLHAKFCNEQQGSKVDVCIFKSMKTLGEKCTHILGDLLIESDDEVYTEKLRNLTHLFGGIFIMNTTLENVKFLFQLKYIAYLEEDSILLRVEDNDRMKKFALPGLKHVISNGRPYGLIQTNLEGHINVPYIHYNDCAGDKIHTFGPKWFKNCYALDDLIIKDDNVSSDIYQLNFEIVLGRIEISNTNLHNLSFVAEMGTFGTREDLSGSFLLDVHHNPNLTRLGWNYIFDMMYVPPLRMNIEKNHPDFCLTVKEMNLFIIHDPNFRYLDARICDGRLEEGACQFSRMVSMKKECQYLIGDVLLKSGDENHVKKLEAVDVIFGTLTIRNTNLKDLSFLKLANIVNFNENLPAVIISNNTKLKQQFVTVKDGSTLFVSTGKIISANPKTMLLNGDGIFKSTKECMQFQQYSAANITYNGGNCRMIDQSNREG